MRNPTCIEYSEIIGRVHEQNRSAAFWKWAGEDAVAPRNTAPGSTTGYVALLSPFRFGRAQDRETAKTCSAPVLPERLQDTGVNHRKKSGVRYRCARRFAVSQDSRRGSRHETGYFKTDGNLPSEPDGMTWLDVGCWRQIFREAECFIGRRYS